MREKSWVHGACVVMSGLALVSAVSAGCYVTIDTYCCSISASRPTTTGACQDQITSNPAVTHVNNAGPGLPGKSVKAVTDPGPICEWDDWGGEPCIYLWPSSSECNPARAVGAACTGEGNP